MPVEKIKHYKKTMSLGFCSEPLEMLYQQFQQKRGRSTGIYALTALVVINLSFAFLEYWILGLSSTLPLYSYLALAMTSVLVILFSTISSSSSALKARVLLPGVVTLVVLLGSVYLQEYRLYHAIEIVLLVVWLGSLNILGFRVSAVLGLVAIALFTTVAYLSGATDLKLSGLLAMLVATYALALYLAYMLERLRRLMFLTNQSLQDVFNRQENWAYTLIDLDMSLSGILQFGELVARLMENMKTVIRYDSFVLTALEGKGPKPEADLIEGTLFEQEDNTLWSDDLLTKLTQTRQASTSAQFELEKGFMGKEKKKFQHYRMDIPVFNDSTLAAVISLRRASEQFDDLDMVASVSLASQAMMIYKRSEKSSLFSTGIHRGQVQQSAVKTPEIKVQQAPQKIEKSEQKPAEPATEGLLAVSPTVHKVLGSPSTDIDLTAEQTLLDTASKRTRELEESVIPSDVIKKMKESSESARKTITLLSRENAEHVAIDRYRTAAMEGEHLSLLLVEVDGLSAIREKDGDQAAYKVFAGIVKHVFSKTDQDRDVLGRYGQNGFSILLPRVDMNAAERFAEALRQYTEESTFKTPYGERTATLSIGVAAITDETGNHDSMVKRADMALFVAKKNGRNCVKVRL